MASSRGNPYGRGASKWEYFYGPHFMGGDNVIDASHGMITDLGVNQAPNGYVRSAYDVLVDQPGVIRKRGGTSYVGSSTMAANGAAVAYADFPAGGKICPIDGNGTLYTLDPNTGTLTSIGALGSAFLTKDKPKTKIGGGKNLLIVTANDGTTAPKTFDGTTIANLGGTPPAGMYAEIYKSRVLLGRTSANPNRLFFSPTPDPTTTWDTTNSWIDFDYPITGLAALSNQVLVFSRDHCERLTGSTPPPNSDMDRQPVGAIGCPDARAIHVASDVVYFANARGVYKTNGVGFECLSQNIKSLWQDICKNIDFTSSFAGISLGVFGDDWLIVCIFGTGGTPIPFLCYLPRLAWTRLTPGLNAGQGICARMFSACVGTPTTFVVYVDGIGTHVTNVGTMFTSNINALRFEADGATAVAPTITYGLMGWRPQLQAFGHGFLSYSMERSGAETPSLAVQVGTHYDGASDGALVTPPDLSAVAESPFTFTSAATTSAGTGAARKRFSINRDGHGLWVQLSQSGASIQTEIYGLEYQGRPYPATADG